jgi:non-ribosomal peptide synthetase component F
VPLDTASPAARIAKIVAAAAPALALVDPRTQRLWNETTATRAARRPSARLGALAAHPLPEVRCAFTGADLRTAPAAAAEGARRPGDEACTCCSHPARPATPKGVVITHANVLAFLDWALAHFAVGPADRCSSHPPLHFDLSTFDVWGTLASGAELHLVGEGQSLLPHKLADWIRDSRITQWFSVPSILTYLSKLGALRERDFPSSCACSGAARSCRRRR